MSSNSSCQTVLRKTQGHRVGFTGDLYKISMKTKLNFMEYFNKYYCANEKNRKLTLLLLNCSYKTSC